MWKFWNSKQQQQMMQDYQRLLSETATLKLTIQQFMSETSARLGEGLDTLEKRMLARQDRLTSPFEQQLIDQLTAIRGRLETQQITLSQQANTLSDEQRKIQQDIQELAGRLDTEDLQSHTRLQQTTARLDAEREAQGRMMEETRATLEAALQHSKSTLDQTQRDLQHSVTALQGAIDHAHQQAIKEASTLVEQRARDLSQGIETLESDQAKGIALLTGQLEQMDTAITTAKQTAESSQHHSRIQEQRLDELEHQLEEEREARRGLEQQLAELSAQQTLQMEEIKGTVTAHHSELEQLMTELSHLQCQLHEARETWAASLITQDQTQHTRLQEATAALAAEQETQGHQLEETSAMLQQAKHTLEQVQHDLQHSMPAMRAAIDHAQRAAVKDATALIEQHAREQAKDVAMLTDQLEQRNMAITAAKTEAEGRELHATAQDQRLSELVRLLEEEKQARLALSQQLVALTQRANARQGKPRDQQRRK
jgi:myosin heavy chain 6/7